MGTKPQPLPFPGYVLADALPWRRCGGQSAFTSHAARQLESTMTGITCTAPGEGLEPVVVDGGHVVLHARHIDDVRLMHRSSRSAEQSRRGRGPVRAFPGNSWQSVASSWRCWLT